MMRVLFPFFVVAAAALLPTLSLAEQAVVKETTQVTGPLGIGVVELTAGTRVDVRECSETTCELGTKDAGTTIFVDKSILQFEETTAPATSNTATVNGDVDLYDVPGGVGTVIGMLEEGSEHTLLQCKSDNWCEVDSGWVWGDFLDR